MDSSQAAEQFTIVVKTEIFVAAMGAVLLGRWLFKTYLGTRALINSRSRRNNMPPFMPFLVMFIWFGCLAAGTSITSYFLPNISGWQAALAENINISTAAIVGIVATILVVRRFFSHGLKGFGLDARSVRKDFVMGVVNLIAISPVIMAVLLLTILAGEFLIGPGFEISPHEELDFIATHDHLMLRVMIFLTAGVIVPIFEEMLFRGLFQTMLRSFFGRPWLSIALVSALFAMVHGDIWHWPALFALSICMGYAYEKSGSLLRSIFIHAFFNVTNLVAMLCLQ